VELAVGVPPGMLVVPVVLPFRKLSVKTGERVWARTHCPATARMQINPVRIRCGMAMTLLRNA
jgi:hypothetical protein